MPSTFETAHFEALSRLAAERFGEPTTAEKEVLRLSASAFDDNAKESTDRPEIRAAFLRWLAIDNDCRPHIDPLGIRTHNATVPQVLDLNFCKLPFPLLFDSCTFKDDLMLVSSQLPAVYLLNCKTERLVLADGLNVAGDFSLRRHVAAGEIRLVGAEIAGNLECGNATLNATWDALSVNGAKVNGSVFLNDGFTSYGSIYFTGAEIGGRLTCENAQVRTFDCRGMRMIGDLIWKSIRQPTQTDLQLYGATIGALQDERKSWPTKGHLHLQDFVYKDLVLSGAKVLKLAPADRVEWVSRQPEDELKHAQPWVQLAKLFEANGDADGAKRVIYEYHRQQVRDATPEVRLASLPYDLLEEQPLWIAPFILSLGFMGALVFWRADRMHAMAPTDKDAREALDITGKLPSGYAPFNPVVYALENVLPVVKFGQDAAWAPNHQAVAGDWLPNRPSWLRALAARWVLTRYVSRLSYRRLAILRWTLILLGWASAIILAAAIGNRFKP